MSAKPTAAAAASPVIHRAMRTNQRSQLGRVRAGEESDLSEDFEGEGGISLRWGKTAHYKNVHRWGSKSNFVLAKVPPKGFR